MTLTLPVQVKDAFQQLDQIYLRLSENPAIAEKELTEFEKHHSMVSNRLVSSKIKLLKLVLASIYGTYHLQKIQDKQLLLFFEKNKLYNEAGLLVLTKARHLFTSGKINEGEQLVKYFETHFLGNTSEAVEMVYLTRITFLLGKNQEYEERTRWCLEALKKLKQSENQTPWNFNLQTIFYTNIADSFFKTGDFEKALPYLENSLKIANSRSISVYNRFNVYSFFAFFFEVKKDWVNSVAWHEKIIELLKDDPNYEIYTNQSYMMAAMLYYKMYTDPKPHYKSLMQELSQKQKSYLELVGKKIRKDKNDTRLTYWNMGMARMHYTTGNYKAALRLTRACAKTYRAQGHVTALNDCLQLEHEICFALGKKEHNLSYLYKAYEVQQKQFNLVLKDWQESNKNKIERIEKKYIQYKKDSDEKLIQARVNSLEKELQISSISLQEKRKLLDDIKTYVLSYKNKDAELGQFIRDITQKINSIQLTEQDKMLVQQKLSKENSALFQKLQEKYPELTPNELRGCSLIKTGLSNKELSKLYGMGEKSYELLRYRIKKKLKLDRNQNLVKFLLEFELKNTTY